MITIDENVALGPLHTMGIDVKARKVIRFDDTNDLPGVLRLLEPGEIPLVMGQGSNMLFTADYPGTILIPENKEYSLDGRFTQITVDAGTKLDKVIELLASRGVWWMENLSGIPGTVGASVVQNVGAYGAEIGEVVERVDCFNFHTGYMEVLTGEDCKFGYRDSVFKHDPGRLVLQVTYRIDPQADPRLDYGNVKSIISDVDSVTPMQVREAIIALRDSKLPNPAVTGSAGSFFKNPVISAEKFEELRRSTGINEIPHFVQPDGVKVPAAWLIDHAGCKAFTAGGAGVWQKQPLVIVNATGEAKPDDILALERKIVDAVERYSGITLYPEVQHI